MRLRILRSIGFCRHVSIRKQRRFLPRAVCTAILPIKHTPAFFRIHIPPRYFPSETLRNVCQHATTAPYFQIADGSPAVTSPVRLYITIVEDRHALLASCLLLVTEFYPRCLCRGNRRVHVWTELVTRALCCYVRFVMAEGRALAANSGMVRITTRPPHLAYIVLTDRWDGVQVPGAGLLRLRHCVAACFADATLIAASILIIRRITNAHHLVDGAHTSCTLVGVIAHV